VAPRWICVAPVVPRVISMMLGGFYGDAQESRDDTRSMRINLRLTRLTKTS
jgi:hypothetical protein